nr:uncharacterized protein LOC104115701 isoform X2 [Nicotiana tomentosiformis]
MEHHMSGLLIKKGFIASILFYVLNAYDAASVYPIILHGEVLQPRTFTTCHGLAGAWSQITHLNFGLYPSSRQLLLKSLIATTQAALIFKTSNNLELGPRPETSIASAAWRWLRFLCFHLVCSRTGAKGSTYLLS